MYKNIYRRIKYKSKNLGKILLSFKRKIYAIDGIVSPQMLYVEALAFNMSIFRVRTFKERFKVKQGHKCGALIQ